MSAMRIPAHPSRARDAVAPIAARGPRQSPAAAVPAGAVERATQLGHHFGRVSVSPPAAGPQPIQAAGLLRAYMGLKHGVEKAGGVVSAGYKKVTGAIKGTRLYQGAASVAKHVGERKEDLEDKFSNLSVVKDARAISRDSGFKKARAVMGILGLAGGTTGKDARESFRAGWEKHIASLPEEEREDAEKALLHKQGAVAESERAEDEEREARHQRVLARRRARALRRQRAVAPPAIEMQDMGAPQPPNRFGDANDPFADD